MKRSSRLRSVLLLAAAALLAGGIATVPRLASAATPVRIMPLGDSITGNNGCWRALLWQHLQSTGYTNIDFVGTLNNVYCTGTFDGDNEGHGGYLATNIANQGLLPGWLSSTKPDIVIMHLGTNDVWNNIAPATILDAFSTLLTQMRASNPNVKLLVAQIIPMNPSGCADCGQRAVNFNAAIPAWASSHSTAQSPITVVDQWTGFNTATDTTDGVHPNDTTGIQKMESRWYPPLTVALGAPTPSSAPPTTRAPSSAPPSSRAPSSAPPTTRAPSSVPPSSRAPSSAPPTGPATCSTTYQVNSQWPGGFGATVTLRNTGATALSSWTVRWTLGSGQTITQLWNGVLTVNGTAVTVKNQSYNGTIPGGGSTTFGFNGTWSGTNPIPTLTCTSP